MINHLILSGDFISTEMQAEFGEMLPIFLPVGGQFLINKQVAECSTVSNFALIPSSYNLSAAEKEVITRFGVNLIQAEATNKLGASLRRGIEAIMQLRGSAEPLKVTFGDTLINDQELENDVVGYGNAPILHAWSVYNSASNNFEDNSLYAAGTPVMCGVMQISNPTVLYEELIRNEDDFYKSINNLMDSNFLRAHFIKNWHDLGHINTFFQSRKYYTTERVFNSIKVNNKLLKKSGCKSKMNYELSWFKELPEALQTFVPKVISGDHHYKIEYVSNFTLAETFVFGKLPIVMWQEILNECFCWLDEAGKYKNTSKLRSNWDIEAKTRLRLKLYDINTSQKLKKYLDNKNLSIDEFFKTIELDKIELVDHVITHGDFCFSNIFYSYRDSSVKLIDPRGCDFSGYSTILGHPYYDVAKLGHSIIGRYDEIIALHFDQEKLLSEFSLEFYETCKNLPLCNIFIDFLKDRNIPVAEIKKIIIHLFLSMIPLHSDDATKQLALLRNALNLWEEI